MSSFDLNQACLCATHFVYICINTLTANYEYSRSNRDHLLLPIQMQLSEKPKAFSQFVIEFLESTLNFEHFEKTMSLIAQKYFWSYWLRKTCLLKCIKGLVSENPLTVNVLTSPKNCWNLQKSTFNLLSHHFEPAWVRKSHFQWDPGFQHCFLTRWLPTNSILVIIRRIYRYQFKCNYLKNKKHFLNFLLHFCNLH